MATATDTPDQVDSTTQTTAPTPDPTQNPQVQAQMQPVSASAQQPVPTQAPQAPAQAPPPPQQEHSSFLSQLLHAVGEVFAPSTTQQVNPQTGAIETRKLNTGERVVGGILQGIGGAAAGLSQHGPGSVGRGFAAGAEQQQAIQQAQQAKLQAQSQNIRETNEAEQQKQLMQANLAKLSQEQARGALDLQVRKQELDEHQTALANSMQEIMNTPGAKLLQHFDSNSDINKHLETVGPQLSKQYAIDLAKNNIRLVQNPKGGFDAIEVPKKWGEQPIGEGHELLEVTPDPKHEGQLTLVPHDADPSMTRDQFLQHNGDATTAYNSAQEQKERIKVQEQQIATGKAEEQKAKAGTTEATVNTEIAAQNAGVPIPGQKLTQTPPNAQTGQTYTNVPTASGQTVRENTTFLNSLTPQRKDLIQSLGTGHVVAERLGYLLGKKEGQQLIQQLVEAYPDTDTSKLEAYPGVVQQFESTKNAAGFALNAGSTALKHLRELHDANTTASHIPGTKDYRRYQTIMNTLAPELAKFYGDTTIPAIEGYKRQFDTTLPGGRNTAIREQARLMGNKFDSYEQQWKNAAPSPAWEAEMPNVDVETKNARAALDPNYAHRIAPVDNNIPTVGKQVSIKGQQMTITKVHPDGSFDAQ